MKKIQLFVLEDCPYCVKARTALNELLALPRYQGIEIELIDERKEARRADQFDYYYVPSFYVDGVKKSEGAVDKAGVQAILDEVLQG